jgi:hypothetical protein
VAGILKSLLSLVDRLAEKRELSPAARTWLLLRGHAPTIDASVAEALTHVDGKSLDEARDLLKGMLEEIDELSRELPEDARPIGVAARSLVERSIEECRKPKVNAARLAADMQQVGALALAMRERLLLSPWSRRPLPPS